jgi:hypothetical protein
MSSFRLTLCRNSQAVASIVFELNTDEESDPETRAEELNEAVLMIQKEWTKRCAEEGSDADS